MTAPKSAKPATESTVSGLQEVDRRAQQINFQANHFSGDFQAHHHTSGSMPVWSANVPINQCEPLRVELRQQRTHVVLDLRRYRGTPEGDLLATKRGFTLALRHLPAMKALIDATFVQAQADGLLDDTVAGGAS